MTIFSLLFWYICTKFSSCRGLHIIGHLSFKRAMKVKKKKQQQIKDRSDKPIIQPFLLGCDKLV